VIVEGNFRRASVVTALLVVMYSITVLICAGRGSASYLCRLLPPVCTVVHGVEETGSYCMESKTVSASIDKFAGQVYVI